MGMLVDSIKTWCYNKTDKVVGFFYYEEKSIFGREKTESRSNQEKRDFRCG